MPDENLLATLEQGLRQSRATRSRLAARLADLEAEAERVRTELNEMDAIISQTEQAMFRILSSMFGAAQSAAPPSDAEIEFALRRDAAANAPRVTPQAPQSHAQYPQGGPLHVNELYNRLLEGGFQFTGQNPTISIAVSLNRNRRFRKVAPGTFDLTIRDAAQAS